MVEGRQKNPREEDAPLLPTPMLRPNYGDLGGKTPAISRDNLS